MCDVNMVFRTLLMTSQSVFVQFLIVDAILQHLGLGNWVVEFGSENAKAAAITITDRELNPTGVCDLSATWTGKKIAWVGWRPHG